MSTQVETRPDHDINEKAAAVRALIHSILAASIFWRRWKRWCALVGAVEAVVVVVGEIIFFLLVDEVEKEYLPVPSLC